MSAKFSKESFDSKWIESDTGCWEWQAVKNQDGYGRVKRLGVLCSAHRVAYELYKGPLGDKHVCHTCDNPGCVNPDHLWLGTHIDNQKDKALKKRAVGNAMPGESHPSHKLTSIVVLDIFYSKESVKSLSYKYKVSQSLIQLIKSGKRWKHITNPLCSF
jgi:hypothetical protein